MNKQKIVKSNHRLIHIQNEFNIEDNSLNKNEEINISVTEASTKRTITDRVNIEKKTQHKRITFEEESPPKKVSILERLGNRLNDNSTVNSVKNRISLSEFRKEEEPFLKYGSDNRNEEKLRDWRRRKEHRSERSRRENDRKNSPEERKRDRSRERKRDRSNEIRTSARKEVSYYFNLSRSEF